MLQDVGKLIIDLKAVAKNYKQLQALLPTDARAGGVLKANAYGLGAKKVAQTLYDSGCRDFFVAKPSEGEELGFLAKDAKIYILNGYYKSKSELYLQHRLIPVIGSFAEIEEIKDLQKYHNVRLPCYLKFNTGMNRLGFGSVEQDQIFDNPNILKELNVLGIMSHLACADEKDHLKNQEQLKRFKKIAEIFPDIEKSFANSSGIFLGKKYHYNLVRPGAALYGINPTPGLDNPMHRVVTLNLPIIRTRLIYEGANVGYGASWASKQKSVIATVGAGYADGIFRCLSNKGKLYWGDYACPIVGKISMDLMSVDISNIPDDERPRFGDLLQLLGDKQSADDLATDANTIGYEILTSLGQRYDRMYLE